MVYRSRHTDAVPIIGPGIPEVMADDRAARVRDLTYEASFTVPATRTEPVRGRITARFTLGHADHDLAFDFAQPADKLLSARVNGATTSEVVSRDGHLVVPAALLQADAENEVTFAFIAGDEALNRQDELLYTLFVPARASLALPVFDQPNLKGRWVVSLNVPDDWVAVANGAETGRVESNGRTEIIFAKTEPLPTYLVAFAAGKFRVETADRAGRTFRMFHRETDAAKVARNADAVFDLHASSVAWLEDYTASPYAFGKFDFVLIPSFQFGGMEHAGAVFYNQSSLLLDESATQNQRLGRASLIAHETAHMWFGDLVTMRWFNDVWMKEVFANFMAAKIVNPSFPDVNHDLRFLLSNYPSAYEVDRTAGANPIRQVLDNLNEAGSMYGAIIYQKAPVVMRHLEALLGVENFRDGLREYLKQHAFGNATWSDLIAVLDARTPIDLEAWSHVWVDEPGRPTIRTELSIRDGRIARLAFRQEDPRGRGLLWPQELRVAIGGAGGQEMITVDMRDGVAEVPAAIGKPAPRYVLPSAAGWAYGEFVLDPASLAYLSASVPELADPLTRGSAWVTLWDALLNGQVPPAAVLDLALGSLPREADEQLTSRILGYASDTWWRFLNTAERETRAPRFESLLREGLAAAKTPSQKSAWFGTLRNVAVTPATVGWLQQVWAQKENVPGLPLSEPDYTSLALGLAVRQVDGWSGILQTQLGRIENPDRKGRFAFVMPALSADAAERDRWFASLGDVGNRRREPWVLEGLNYLHHPLRAEGSRQYVQQSLDMLWEIQKTGDIFFPKRWLDVTLGGHSSPEVADTVRSFLKNLPANYPERLRNITLQSADELFRAANLRSKQ